MRWCLSVWQSATLECHLYWWLQHLLQLCIYVPSRTTPLHPWVSSTCTPSSVYCSSPSSSALPLKPYYYHEYYCLCYSYCWYCVVIARVCSPWCSWFPSSIAPACSGMPRWQRGHGHCSTSWQTGPHCTHCETATSFCCTNCTLAATMLRLACCIAPLLPYCSHPLACYYCLLGCPRMETTCWSAAVGLNCPSLSSTAASHCSVCSPQCSSCDANLCEQWHRKPEYRWGRSSRHAIIERGWWDFAQCKREAGVYAA